MTLQNHTSKTNTVEVHFRKLPRPFTKAHVYYLVAKEYKRLWK